MHPVAPSPTNLTHQQEGENIVISWNPPNEKEYITGYIVYYTNDTNIKNAPKVNGSSTHKTTVSGVKAGYWYYFSVIAISAQHLPSEPISSSIFLGLHLSLMVL